MGGTIYARFIAVVAMRATGGLSIPTAKQRIDAGTRIAIGCPSGRMFAVCHMGHRNC